MLRYHFGYDGSGSHRGKRLRPRLVFAAAGECGAKPEDALDAAVAVELLHNYSLVHDDIEDGDRFRHGRETLWVRYGLAQAINAGDAMCALSFLALLRARGTRAAGTLAERLHAAHLAMCEGQSLDLRFEQLDRVGPGEYETMIAGKTAALFGAACALGAMCANASSPTVESYDAIGRSFGMAFQIYDDLLGIWGNAKFTGKSSGSDIARRKKTFPVLWALQRTGPAREIVARAYASRGEMGDELIGSVVLALDEVGAREAALKAAANHFSAVGRAPAGAVRELLLSVVPLRETEEALRP